MCSDFTTGVKISRLTDPLPSTVRVRDQAELAEVELQLVTGLAVVDPHRRAPPAAADIADLQGVAVQRPLRHHDPAAAEQLHRPSRPSAARS